MPQLSIVVPTFNEVDNVVPLRDLVAAALVGVDWELIFVDDDSPDGTAEVLRGLAQSDPRVRCLLRIGRRGLTTACVEGVLGSSSPIVAVMDADLQHDERLLPRLYELVAAGEADVAVGSRYVSDGSSEGLSKIRLVISRVANRIGLAVLKVHLHDPMSGYFVIRRDAFEGSVRSGISGVGFKVLLDVIASSPTPLRVRELPYGFRARGSGHSKLDSKVAWEFLIMLLDKSTGGLLPVRFIAFSIIGLFGLGVHLVVLAVLYRMLEVDFLAAQTASTLVAMTFNFALNNVLTYRDLRLRGWAMVRGWLTFVAACSIGALANIGVAHYLFRSDGGWVGAAVAGVLIGAVWNFAATAVLTWRPRTRRATPTG